MHLLRRREAAELSWEPEPDATFIGKGALRRNHTESNGKQCRGNGQDFAPLER